jgi:hypothetical protein
MSSAKNKARKAKVKSGKLKKMEYEYNNGAMVCRLSPVASSGVRQHARVSSEGAQSS